FSVTVHATDTFWNRNRGLQPPYNSNIGDHVYIVSNDSYIVNNATQPMNQGQFIFNTLSPHTAQSGLSLTAIDTDSGTVSSQTISGILVNPASNAYHFQILLPGEIATPGLGSYANGGGKVNPPSQQ